MWLLVVYVAGMSVFSATYGSYDECARVGRAKSWELASRNKLGAGWSCTKQ